MPYCSSCGASIPADARYCPACGTARSARSTGVSPLESIHASFTGRTWLNALFGAVTGFILAFLTASAFVPFYVFGIFGGAVLAGYLQGPTARNGLIVGSLSGLLATIPVLFMLFIVVVIGLTGVLSPLLGQFLPTDVAVFGAMSLVWVVGVGIALTTASTLLFGGIGGLLGSMLRSETSIDHDR